MTRVGQVVQHLRPGGIETLVLELARLAPAGQVTDILSLEGTRAAALAAWPRLAQTGAALEFFDKGPGWRIGLIAALRRRFRQSRPRAIHTHHVGPLIYGGIAGRLAGVPRIIHTEHDAWHLQDSRRRSLQRLILALVRPRLVADSEAVAAAVRGHLPGWPVQVIRNGVDTGFFTPGDRVAARAALGCGAALPMTAPLVGCAARLHPVKGHRFLLDALARLNEGVHLALAGGGEEEAALRAQSAALGLRARVHFLGSVEVMTGFYRALDLFCLPSLAEGMPLSPLEAQACGCPVVVTAVGGAGETLCPASGRLVPPGDAAALAAAIAGQLARVGAPDPRPFVLAHGNADAMVAAYAALYE